MSAKIRPNGLFFILFHGDDQWLSGVPAEWSSAFSIVRRLMCKESRVISRVAIFFVFKVQRSMGVGQSGQAEWPSLLLSKIDAESVLCFCCFFCIASR